MDRKLAHVEKIVDIQPIDGADRIMVATVLGWKCVIAKSDGFNVGDKIVYVEVDSIVPEKPEFEFLKDRKYRVRTIKLRKQISQGLVLPLSILPEGRYKEGQDVTDILGIVKYDPQAEKESKEMDVRFRNPIVKFLSRYSWFRKVFLRKPKGGFPSWISKTDEERVQNLVGLLHKEYRNLFSVTEKLDGQSATYFLRNVGTGWFGKTKYEFGVCSRNLRIKTPNNSSYWKIAIKYNIEQALYEMITELNFDYIVLQGEIIGEGIQGNKYGVRGYDFYAYNLVSPDGRVDSINSSVILDDYNIKFVPILDTIQLPNSVDDLVKMSYGKSALKDVQREGLVLRAAYNPEISFKVINPDFLLKNEE